MGCRAYARWHREVFGSRNKDVGLFKAVRLRKEVF